MLVINKAIKREDNAAARKLLKSLAKRVRDNDGVEIKLSFTLDSQTQWFEDNRASFREWQVITVWMIEIGVWKKEDQEEEYYRWYYGRNK